MIGAQYVVFIHDDVIAEVWPGSGEIAKGCRDLNLLESAVARPFQTAFGSDAYPTTIEKGVALFHSLISNHPFHDGNKRTAVTAFYAFLLANEHYLALTNDELYALAKSTASYRERGLSHKDVLVEIHDKLRDWIIPFSALRKGAKNDPAFGRTYENAKKMRLFIRRSRWNRLIDTN